MYPILFTRLSCGRFFRVIWISPLYRIYFSLSTVSVPFGRFPVPSTGTVFPRVAYSRLPPSDGERIPQSRPQFGSEAATRLREAGVASNRGSARRGECVPGPCTHRPSHHPSRLHPKSPAQSARGGGAEGVEGNPRT